MYCLELAGATVLAAKILRVGADAYRVEPPELVMIRLGSRQPFRQERDQPARVNAEAAGDFGLWRNNAPSRRILPSAIAIFLAQNGRKSEAGKVLRGRYSLASVRAGIASSN